MVDDMFEHYAAQDEGQRLLRSGHGRLELARMRELFIRFLPPAPSVLLDVGGGTGIHAIWLAERGYEVQLIDPVPRHVDEAAAHGTFQASVGDARQLPNDDASVDAVLLLGRSTTRCRRFMALLDWGGRRRRWQG